MKTALTREKAIGLLREYNKEPFHVLHGLTVGGVLKWYARELGYGDEADFWEICGILHDIDFEQYPEEHCLAAPRLLREGGAEEEVIHAVCSHCYGHHPEITASPDHEMEKVLYAADETYDHLSLLADLSLVHTDLIGAGGFGDPGFSVPDHKDIDAALVIFYRVFLVLMKLQGLHHGPVHRNFQERCRSGVEGPVHEKEKERCKEYVSWARRCV